MPTYLLDAMANEIPRTADCLRAGIGDCAPPPEKFADTFAKWAFRGVVTYHTSTGFHPMLPPSIEAWARR